MSYLAIIGAAFGIWYLLVGLEAALIAAIIVLLAGLIDLAILLSLPRLSISFGPIPGQFMLLEGARWILAVVAAPVGSWLGVGPVLVGLGLLQFLGVVSLCWGAYGEAQMIQVTRHTLEAFPGGTPALRLLHVSDIHLERFGRRESKLLELIHELEPDLILLTGDYINLSYVDDPRAFEDARHLLQKLRAPGGVYAVLGSPEVDRRSAPLFRDLSICLLRDERIRLDLGQGRRIDLLGLEISGNHAKDSERLTELASPQPVDGYRLLLYHSPELAHETAEAGIDLYLCGHTHGGQICLPLYGALLTSSALGKEFEKGLYQRDGCTIYVSRGVGLEGMGAPRLRFLSRPEIACFTLVGRP